MILMILGILDHANAGTRSASTSDLLLRGDEAYGWLGEYVATGDVNNDGSADVIVASPGEDTTGSNVGVLRVFYGPISNSPVAPELSEAQVTISATAPLGAFGRNVAVANLIGDASPDLVIADPYHDGGGTDAGRVYVFEGPVSGTLDAGAADVVITGDSPGDLLGWSLLVGNVDTDSADDLVLGAPGAVGDDGQVYIWSGGVAATDDEPSDAHHILTGGVPNGEAGTALALLGPLGDTFTYLAVSAPEVDGNGVVYFVDTEDTATGDIDILSDHEITATTGTRLGEGLVSTYGSEWGLLVANNDPGGGEVHYFEDPWQDVGVGAADGRFSPDESGGDTSVVSMANVGDVDGADGDDVLFGDPLADRESIGGAAYLFYNGELANGSGGANLSDSTEIFYSSSLASFGESLAGADFNADGKSDLLVGAKYSDVVAPYTYDAGMAHLFYGPFDRLEGTVDLADADTLLPGEDAGDAGGYSVASLGDVNCDGVPDFGVGAAFADETSTVTGGAYVFFGPTPESADLAWLNESVSLSLANVVFYGDSSADWAGNTISGAGDVNGDGCDDFLIAAAGDDTAATNAGAVYLFYGDASHEAAVYGPSDAGAEFQGKVAGEALGTSVSATGDLDLDGYADFLIGAPYTAWPISQLRRRAPPSAA